MSKYTSITYTQNLVSFSVDNVISDNENFTISSSLTEAPADVTLARLQITIDELTLAFNENDPNQPTCSLGASLHSVINDDTTKTALLAFINNESQFDVKWTNLNYPEVAFVEFLSYLKDINTNVIEDNINSGDTVEFIFRFSGGTRTGGTFYTVKVPFDVIS